MDVLKSLEFLLDNTNCSPLDGRDLKNLAQLQQVTQLPEGNLRDEVAGVRLDVHQLFLAKHLKCLTHGCIAYTAIFRQRICIKSVTGAIPTEDNGLTEILANALRNFRSPFRTGHLLVPLHTRICVVRSNQRCVPAIIAADRGNAKPGVGS